MHVTDGLKNIGAHFKSFLTGDKPQLETRPEETVRHETVVADAFNHSSVYDGLYKEVTVSQDVRAPHEGETAQPPALVREKQVTLQNGLSLHETIDGGGHGHVVVSNAGGKVLNEFDGSLTLPTAYNEATTIEVGDVKMSFQTNFDSHAETLLGPQIGIQVKTGPPPAITVADHATFKMADPFSAKSWDKLTGRDAVGFETQPRVHGQSIAWHETFNPNGTYEDMKADLPLDPAWLQSDDPKAKADAVVSVNKFLDASHQVTEATPHGLAMQSERIGGVDAGWVELLPHSHLPQQPLNLLPPHPHPVHQEPPTVRADQPPHPHPFFYQQFLPGRSDQPPHPHPIENHPPGPG